MSSKILEILSGATTSICGVQTKSELTQSMEAGFSALGFGSFSLSCYKANKHDLALNPTLSTWPDWFMAEYEHRNWADWNPNLERAATSNEAFSWNLDQRYSNRNEQSYIDFLMSTPMKGGLSIPLSRRPGTISGVSVESHKAKHFTPAIVSAVTVIAHAAQMKAEMLGLCPEISADESWHLRALSASQLEILKWLSEGKSYADIATIMQLSERAIKYHVGEILRKFGVATRSQAVAMYANGSYLRQMPKPRR
ncbi:helix-turn-helix transcriptional regulator [Hyphomicrobium sp.]|uniref:helix-turn-helix transcriptional regulator n=1 Tax=Hyphomicrobium sp. TaxID=82 RepID=UPI002E3095A0|nr:LuxR C-terminal-related transcriptional regulator [Hyphomicrobium sp.]HEX2840463.1 LuxR C-terminal-related transcriptional regulator [Hyphomicrobium sp.]